MEIQIRPQFWNRTLMRFGIGQELIMKMYIEDTVDFVRPFLIGKVSKIMKGIPIEKIEMMIENFLSEKITSIPSVEIGKA